MSFRCPLNWTRLLVALALAACTPRLQAQSDPAAMRQAMARGAYAETIAQATQAVLENSSVEEFHLMRVEALAAVGRLAEARAAVEETLSQLPRSLRARLLGYEVMRRNGDPDRAALLLAELDQLVGSREWAYRNPADRVAMGRAALLLGVDPKRVLERFYDPVKKSYPEFQGVWIASGELALQKSDFALAAKTFAEALKKFPNEADLWLGLARAYEPTETEPMLEALQKALSINARLTPAHLLLAEHHIDAERYEEAGASVRAALGTDPEHAVAHALGAVVAELKGDSTGYAEGRAAALKLWAGNPEVDHVIGRKFSQKYRFAEGAERQRHALSLDANYTAAKIQLAQDLLRLGQTEEGWAMAEAVHQADPYDVVAFNLVTLKESIADFKTIESENFIVRMDQKEAAIYGDRVITLLERAHTHLCGKYGLEPKQRTIVEIFPDQKDFAIRTFGLPGGDGYLGVCFGQVITANSPAARPGSTANWEAVLWHEFAHVVTLSLTKNRMPRWLSEGISVYEERQARGSWGEQMKPRYRAMILGEDLTPISQLSGAFLKPKTPVHLMFAYYESSLAVEYLLERFGLPAMKAIFADLAAGRSINDALARHAAPLAQIDAEFAERARSLASGTGPALDWSKPKSADVATDDSWEKWSAANPANRTALMETARKALEGRDWAAAKKPLLKVIELYPEQREPDGAYAMLARAHRELGEVQEELAVLNRLADLSSEATEAYERLMSLAAERQDWPAVLTNSERYAAVNPLSPVPHRFAAQARVATGDTSAAIKDYTTVLQLDPRDPAEVHFQLARLMHTDGRPEARRHLLQALEVAPRYRAALQMLLEVQGSVPPAPKEPVPVP